ncbi:Nuclear pore complex protein Nup133 [Trichuris trichiura]|uniref:Nuclear pore complex protein Nup133 n=1 Tax=Trichuris trichiura TaxID=36087 RepID=A0A077Z606_TRITR|nr:Nuclear pore complex protein Nup133 [Trichuris trichiura]
MRLDPVGLEVPVHVAECLANCEKQKSYSAISCRFFNNGDWISFVCNRMTYFWNLREAEVNCYSLPLPQSGLIYHADLLLVLRPINAEYSHNIPGCIVISPEGVVRYWVKASQPSSYIEATIDVKNEVCKSLALLPETRCCLLATSSGSAYLLPFPDESSKRLPLPIALTSHSQGTIAEVARRFSSIFVPPTRQEDYVSTVFPGIVPTNGQLILTVLSSSLRCWKVFPDLKYTFLWSYDLKYENAFKIFDSFLTEQLGDQWVSNTVVQKRAVSVKVLDACSSGGAVAVLSEVHPIGHVAIFHVVSLFQCFERGPPESPQILFHMQGQPELSPIRLCSADWLPSGIAYSSKVLQCSIIDTTHPECIVNDVIIGTGKFIQEERSTPLSYFSVGIIDNRIAVYLAKRGLTLLTFENDSEFKHLTRDCMIKRLGIRSEAENETLLVSARPFDRFHVAFLYFLNHNHENYQTALDGLAQLVVTRKQLVKLAYRMCGLILDTDEFVGTFSTGLDSDMPISAQLESKGKALEIFSEFLNGFAWRFKATNLHTYKLLVDACLALLEAAVILCSNEWQEIISEIIEMTMRSLLEMKSDTSSYRRQITDIFLQEVSNMRFFLRGFVCAESDMLEEFKNGERLLIWLTSTELINKLVVPFQTTLIGRAKEVLSEDQSLWEMRASVLTQYVNDLLQPQVQHALLGIQEMASCASKEKRADLSEALSPLLHRTIKSFLEVLKLAEELALSDPASDDLRSFQLENDSTVKDLLFQLLDVDMKDLCVQLAEKYDVFPVLAKICAQTSDIELFNRLLHGDKSQDFLDSVNDLCSRETTFGILHEYAIKHGRQKPEMQRCWHTDWLYYWVRQEYALCLRALLVAAENETESLERQRVALSQAQLVRRLITKPDEELDRRLKAAQFLVGCQVFLGNVQRSASETQEHSEKPLTPQGVVQKYMEIADDDDSFYSEALYTALRMVELGIFRETEQVIMDAWAKLVIATEWPTGADPAVSAMAMRGTLFARTLQAL